MIKHLLLSFVLILSITTMVNASSYTSETIKQFDGYVVNGQTARQAGLAMVDRLQTDFTQEYELLVTAYNSSLDRYNAISKEEQSQRNIVAQMSYGWGTTNPYDFIDSGSHATHWLSVNGSELTCQHRTVNGVRLHAKTFIALHEALAELNTNSSRMDDMAKNAERIAKERINNEFPKVLAPFFELKRSDLLTELQKKESNLKEIICNAVVGRGYNPLSGFIPFVKQEKDLICKYAKKCKLDVVEASQHILQVGCTCGHSLTEHKFKYQDKNQG